MRRVKAIPDGSLSVSLWRGHHGNERHAHAALPVDAAKQKENMGIYVMSFEGARKLMCSIETINVNVIENAGSYLHVGTGLAGEVNKQLQNLISIFFFSQPQVPILLLI